jgi:hypothetical protein
MTDYRYAWVVYRFDIVPSVRIKGFRKQSQAQEYCDLLNLSFANLSDFIYKVCYE